MNKQARLPELDLLRFLAACAVMLFHYTFRASLDHAWSGSFPLLSQISKYGYLGVHLFFILSGFVILMTAYQKDALGFCLARFIRLYPAYWICVTLTTLMLICGGKSHTLTLPQYLANLTMGQSFIGIRDISGVYWTLAIELKFYFLIFLLLVFRQASRIHYWLGVWLLASLILSLQSPHGNARFFLFPEWSSYFIAGSMFFLIYREGLSAYKLAIVLAAYGLSVAYALNLVPNVDRGSFEVSGIVLVLVLTAFYLTFLVLALKPRSAVHLEGAVRTPRLTQCAIKGGARCPNAPQDSTVSDPGAVRKDPARSDSRSNAFYLIGLLTYPLYLLHQEFGYILLRLAPAGLNRFLLLALISGAAIGLAWLILIPERWIARRLKTLFNRLQRPAPSAPLSPPPLTDGALTSDLRLPTTEF